MFHVGLDFKLARFLEQFHPHGHREKQHAPDAQSQTGFESLSHFYQDHAGLSYSVLIAFNKRNHVRTMEVMYKGLFICKILADFQFADLGIEGGGFEVQQFGRAPVSTDAPLAPAQGFQDVIPFHLFE